MHWSTLRLSVLQEVPTLGQVFAESVAELRAFEIEVSRLAEELLLVDRELGLVRYLLRKKGYSLKFHDTYDGALTTTPLPQLDDPGTESDSGSSAGTDTGQGDDSDDERDAD